ncbi:MAG: sodium:solute symporter family protein, partial [Myxococcota bacterium]
MSDRLLTLDFGVVALYLLVTLIVGIVKGRGVKTMEQFAIGPLDRYATVVLVATLLSSRFGGTATVGVSGRVFRSGMILFVAQMGTFAGYMLMSKIVAPYAGRFRGMVSAGDMMGSFYGGSARIVTGIAGVCFCLVGLSVQIGAVCYFCQYFFGISKLTSAIIGAEIVVIYTWFGGSRSVAYTDMVQFCVLAISIPLIAIMGVYSVGGTHTFLNQVPSEKLTLFPEGPERRDFMWLFLFFCLPRLVPVDVQRLLMARDARQAVIAFQATGLIRAFLTFCVACIGLIALCSKTSLEPDQAFFHVVKIALPEGCRGFAIAGLIAAVMSSADSKLSSAAIHLTHDVIKPLVPRISDFNERLIAQVTTVVLGNLAILFVLIFDSIFALKIVSLVAWYPPILSPLLLGIMGIKASSRAFLLSSCSGFVMALAWKFAEIRGEGILKFPLVPSIAISAAVLLIARCFDPPEKRGRFDNPFAGKSPLSPK